MHNTPNTTTQTAERARPQLVCDWQEWASYLDGVEATDTEKERIIEELWNIVVAFVDLGWNIGPPDTKTCGQTLDLSAALRAAVINSKETYEQKEAV